jgi:DNA-binding XRE family transcriptional regulator
MENKNMKTLDEIIENHYGKPGNNKRDIFETGYQNFKLGLLVQEARKEKGLTQEALAQRIGSSKSYISKIENNVKEARLSTLQKIIEDGLGGKLHLSIEF